MELELQKCLKQKGYKVAAIVSGLNGLIGKDTFCFEKKYLNGKNRNEEIIININAAVKRLEQDYDIVIVGIPEHVSRLIHNILMILALLHNCLCVQ